jgi:hypothetical protein
MSEEEVYAKTVYAEARGEPVDGQEWVAWVIKNRARLNKGYWGGGSIKEVCLHKGQFECWNGRADIDVTGEPGIYDGILALTTKIRNAAWTTDPTGGCDHYNNPSKEGYPDWTRNCNKVGQIGNHVFYKSKSY